MCVTCPAGKYQKSTGSAYCTTHRMCAAGQRMLQKATVKSDRTCTPCEPHTFSASINAPNCTVCPASQLQPLPDQFRCLSATSKEFVITRNASTRSLEQCPLAVNINDPEVDCGNGHLVFKTGSWHSGLVPAAAGRGVLSSSRFVSPLSRHVYDASMVFYRCPRRDSCTFPNNNTGELVCAFPTRGPLCALCELGYSSHDGGCVSCSSTESWPWSYIVCAALALAWTGFRLCRQPADNSAPEEAHRVEEEEEEQGTSTLWAVAIKRLRPILKQCFSFYQVLTLFGEVYHIPYPPAYLRLMSYFAVFKLNFAFALRLDCIEGYSFHSSLYMNLTLFVSLTVAQAVLLFKLENASQKKVTLPDCFQRTATTIVVVTYACYPTFSNILFKAFNCRDVDGTRYLRSDFRIDCDSAAHQTAQAFAGVGILGCSIGLPLLYLFVLRRHRTDLSDGDSSTSRSTVHLHFFVQDYEQKYWYWESIELARKLLLTGFATLWAPGTLMQVITSMFVGLGNIVLVSNCKPYAGHASAGGGANAAQEAQSNASRTNSFALFSVVMTFLALFGALLSKFANNFISTGTVEQGFSYQTLEAFLIVVAVVVAVFGVSIIVSETRSVAREGQATKAVQKQKQTLALAVSRADSACGRQRVIL